MNMWRILLVGALALGLGGCFSIETAKLSRSGDENVLVTNYGWFLFNKVPIATGNASEESMRMPIAFFRNDVTLDKIQTRMMNYAASREKMVHDLSYHNHESVLLTIPGTNFPFPIPYLLTYREIQLSGVVK